eukprot:351943-Chlamydomonas_euryale.AAC.15
MNSVSHEDVSGEGYGDDSTTVRAGSMCCWPRGEGQASQGRGSRDGAKPRRGTATCSLLAACAFTLMSTESPTFRLSCGKDEVCGSVAAMWLGVRPARAEC